jgi:iron-sulfur cluster assembly protein
MARSRCLTLVLWAFAVALLAGCQTGPAAEPGAPGDAKPAGPDEPPLLTVTPKAAAMVRQYVAKVRAPKKLYLRVRVVPGGCQGFMHKLDLDPDVSAEDHVFDSGGVSVVVFRRQVGMLRGAKVDYGEAGGKHGFKVDNPNFKGDRARKWLALLQKEKDVK